MLLHLAPHEQVELLVGPAQLDVGLQRHRVVGLGQRVQELVHRDGVLRLIALVEVIALQHARNRISGRETDHARGAELLHPG